MTDLEKAKEVIELENKRITDECSKEINEVLKKHNCSLVISGQFEGDKIQTLASIMINK